MSNYLDNNQPEFTYLVVIRVISVYKLESNTKSMQVCLVKHLYSA